VEKKCSISTVQQRCAMKNINYKGVLTMPTLEFVARSDWNGGRKLLSSAATLFVLAAVHLIVAFPMAAENSLPAKNKIGEIPIAVKTSKQSFPGIQGLNTREPCFDTRRVPGLFEKTGAEQSRAELKLPQDWSKNRESGIALALVTSPYDPTRHPSATVGPWIRCLVKCMSTCVRTQAPRCEEYCTKVECADKEP
jgi:hypothetical protein